MSLSLGVLGAFLALALTLLGASASASTYGPSHDAVPAASPLAETAPKIGKNPTSQAIEEGQGVTFSTTATGTAPLSAQWELSTDGGETFSPDGAPTETASAQITVAAVKASENGYQFRVTYSNKAGSAVSKAATLTVHAPPLITHQPTNVTVEEGQNAIFEATAAGLPAPTVQWQVSTNGGTSWNNVSGATSPQLTVKAPPSSSSGQEYRAIFKNTIGSVTSSSATLTVQSRPVVKTSPFDSTTIEGQDAKFLAIGSGAPTPTEQWEVSTDGGGTWNAIAGANSEFLTVTAVTAEMTGWKYRATFTNVAGSATSKSATLTVDSVPVITKQPRGAIVLAGESASFEAAATANPSPTVQWEISTNGGLSWSAISGATSTKFTIASTKTSESGNEYRATFKNTAGPKSTEGAALTVASTQHGAVSWGSNTMGQLGDGNTTTSPVPVPVSNLKFASTVAGGGRHSLALLLSGTVESWGYDGFGQLGDEGIGSVSTPVEVEGLKHVTAIAAGTNHSLALLANGTVMAWGDNESGQLGDGSLEESEVPVPVSGLSEVTAIAAGGEFSLALLSNGTVMSWGSNESGQLGSGGVKSSGTPVAVKGLKEVSAISAGEEFALALLKNGTVESWGNNESDQLGNAVKGEEEEPEETEEEELTRLGAEEQPFSTSPNPVAGLTTATAVAAGKNHGLALRQDGTVVGWGDDSTGEVGNGTIGTKVPLAVPVSSLSAVTQISAGAHTSVALLSSGGVMTWGSEKFGALGNGETTGSSDVPVAVTGVSTAFDVSAGASHMLAVSESIPSVSKVEPNNGPAAGGTSVTLTGTELLGATAVKFGKTAATSFTVNSATSITATAPAGTGAVDVTVTAATGTSPTGASDKYTYLALPTVSKLSAKGGSAAGGTSVTITGTGLSSVTSVNFGSAVSTEVTIHSATSLTVISPVGTGGTALVTVTSGGGTSVASSKFKFKYTPVVSAVSPNSGLPAGGETVTVSGFGFAPGTTESSFKFGKKAATAVNCMSGTSCTMKVPAQAAATVNVIATVGKAKSPVNAPGDSFTYN
jgi:alpha-tubulin suppressor-like RCC1 family protein